MMWGHGYAARSLPMTYGGTNYYISFIDDFTRMTRIYPLKKKTSADILERFKEYKAEMENQTGLSIKPSDRRRWGI
jgi:hypothetical protein